MTHTLAIPVRHLCNGKLAVTAYVFFFCVFFFFCLFFFLGLRSDSGVFAIQNGSLSFRFSIKLQSQSTMCDRRGWKSSWGWSDPDVSWPWGEGSVCPLSPLLGQLPQEESYLITGTELPFKVHISFILLNVCFTTSYMYTALKTTRQRSLRDVRVISTL